MKYGIFAAILAFMWMTFTLTTANPYPDQIKTIDFTMSCTHANPYC